MRVKKSLPSTLRILKGVVIYSDSIAKSSSLLATTPVGKRTYLSGGGVLCCEMMNPQLEMRFARETSKVVLSLDLP